MSGVEIRAALPGDAGAIAALTNRFIRQTAIHFGTEVVAPSCFIDMLARDAGKYPWVVAEVAGAFAGYAKAGIWRERAAYSRTVETAVYVEPSVHKKGVGAALYRRLFEELRGAGFHTAVAGITLPNDASVRLHESVGFVFVGRFAEVGRKFDAWHDVGFWQRPI